jgi:hypothetical protein
MWPFKPKHLQYSSVFAWTEAEKIHGPITDEKLQSKYMDQLGELRQYLFKKHVETLSQIEREQLNAGSHPSQSHEKANEAVKYAELLKSDLLQNGFNVEVGHGCYHMNRVILSVFPDEKISKTGLAKIIPQFFHGYEVKVLFKKQ